MSQHASWGRSMKQHFRMFAAYNQWANRVVYAATADLTPEEFERDVGAFFGSAMGTLNHVLTADRVWLHRFTGQGPLPKTLDEIQHRALAELHSAREAEDKRIIDWIAGLAMADLDNRFSYAPITDPGRIVTQRLGPAVSHLFNHQTHHRGQVHAILTILGKPSISLDLIYFQRTEEGREFA